MLDCDQALELISGKIDGVLTAEESAALEEHLAACPACRALLADLEELHHTLPELAPQPPAELKDNIMAAVRQSKVTPFQGKKKQWRWRSLASLAAVLVLVFVGGNAMRQWDGAASRAGQQAPAAGEALVTNAAMDTETPDVAEATPATQGENAEKGVRNLETAQSDTQKAETQEVEGNALPPATPAPTQTAAPTGTPNTYSTSTQPEERVNPATLTIESAGAELTQADAVEQLALYLGWPADSLTADSSGALTSTGEDGTTRTITCVGLNEAGTDWLCQVEEAAPGGPEASVSCTTYTVPLDGSPITQP